MAVIRYLFHRVIMILCQKLRSAFAMLRRCVMFFSILRVALFGMGMLLLLCVYKIGIFPIMWHGNFILFVYFCRSITSICRRNDFPVKASVGYFVVKCDRKFSGNMNTMAANNLNASAIMKRWMATMVMCMKKMGHLLENWNCRNAILRCNHEERYACVQVHATEFQYFTSLYFSLSLFPTQTHIRALRYR